MKYSKSIGVLVFCIILLSLIASAFGVFSSQGEGKREFQSIHSESITIYGEGIYQRDSVSTASQAIAQDCVTMLVGIPMLIIALYLSRKGRLKGRLLLAGTLGYFLYTYTSYTFLSMYNTFFLVYVMLMSMSFFAFTLVMMTFDIEKISSYFNQKLPVKFISSYLIVVTGIVSLMWLGRIMPALIDGTPPIGLEHYTTLVIQALDFGFVIPVAILAAILLLKRKPFGYLLTPIIIFKWITMLASIIAMMIRLIVIGEKVSRVEMIVFPFIGILTLYCLILILKNIKEGRYN